MSATQRPETSATPLTPPSPDATPATTPATTPAAPVITRPGTTPATRHKLFVNLAVADLQRSITFFEALGFAFSPHFTDHTSTCMPVGEDAYFMFITPERFRGFSGLPLGDPRQATNTLYAISVDTREAVDAMVARAVAAGGTEGVDRTDHGFMYEWSFRDLDGHGWGVFWMDPAAIPG